MDQERLRLRAEGRETARTVLEILGTPSIHRDDPWAEAFVDELRSNLLTKRVKEEGIVRQRTLSALKEYVIQFGSHNGKCLDDIPRDYLEWLLSATEETREMVSQYLRLTATDDDLVIE